MPKTNVGVACTKDRKSLKFYFDSDILVRTGHQPGLTAPHDLFLNDEAKRRHFVISQDMSRMTAKSELFAKSVLMRLGMKFLTVRRDYLEVEVVGESYWRELLPAIIKAIREEMRLDIEVYVERSPRSSGELWHEPLLRELGLVA